MNVLTRAAMTAFICANMAPSMAQVKGVVVDMETKIPVRGVDVIVDGSYVHRDTTDYAGRYSVVGDVRDLTFVRKGYETRVMNRGELSDTIELLPSYRRIDEVVVYGRMPGKHIPVLGLVQSDLQKMGKEPRPGGGASGDFLSWLKVFEKGHVSAKKRRERMKAIENC